MSSSALAPRSLWLHTAALHVVMMEGPFLDTRIAGGKLAMHGRFIHLATKVLIRERAVLHLQPEEDAAQLPVPAEPLVPHHVVTALWDKAKSILSAIRRRCHLCDPSLSPQHHSPLFYHPLPIFWPGRAGQVSLPVQGPM